MEDTGEAEEQKENGDEKPHDYIVGEIFGEFESNFFHIASILRASL